MRSSKKRGVYASAFQTIFGVRLSVRRTGKSVAAQNLLQVRLPKNIRLDLTKFDNLNCNLSWAKEVLYFRAKIVIDCSHFSVLLIKF